MGPKSSGEYVLNKLVYLVLGLAGFKVRRAVLRIAALARGLLLALGPMLPIPNQET